MRTVLCVVLLVLGCAGMIETNTGVTAYDELPATEMPSLLALGWPEVDPGHTSLGQSPWVNYQTDASTSSQLLADQSYTTAFDMKVVDGRIYSLYPTHQILLRDGLSADASRVTLGQLDRGSRRASAIAVQPSGKVSVLMSSRDEAFLSMQTERNLDGIDEIFYQPERRVDASAFGLELGPDGVYYSLSRPYGGDEITTLLRFTEAEDLEPVTLSTPIPIFYPNGSRYIPMPEAQAQLRLSDDWLVAIVHEEVSLTRERWGTIALIHTQTGEVRRVQ
jgi:hypothetical protein